MMPGKRLMDLCSVEAMAGVKARDYETAAVFDMGESAVNNLHHGRPVDQWLPHVRLIVVTNRDRAVKEGRPVFAYNDLLALIDLFAEEYGIDPETGAPA